MKTENELFYLKMTLVDGENSRLIMSKLEALFKRFPNGFARHCEDRADQTNLFGDCWTKELNISRKKFKDAFDVIGKRYNSFLEYLQAADKFQGKYYCSIVVPCEKHRTYYRRNNAVIDREIAALIGSQINSEKDLGLTK